MTNWQQRIDTWRALVPTKSSAPATEAAIQTFMQQMQCAPTDLISLMRTSNGLLLGTTKILPLIEQSDIKRTWDSVQRANCPKSSRFLSRATPLLERFLVFADIGAGRAGVIDRQDGTIWYEDQAQLRQTDLTLVDFIDNLVREQLQG